MAKKRFTASLNISKLAIASLSCAVLAIVMPVFLKILLGTAAIALGVIALKMISAGHGVLYGKGMAWVGIVMPGFLILFLILGGGSKAGSSAFRGAEKVKYNAKHAEVCTSNLRKLGQALEEYKKDHNGSYPAALSELFPKYVSEAPVFWCPGDRDSKRPDKIASEQDALVSYSYTPPEPGDARKLWQIKVLSDNSPDNHSGAGSNVLMGDGLVSWIKHVAVDKKK